MQREGGEGIGKGRVDGELRRRGGSKEEERAGGEVGCRRG